MSGDDQILRRHFIAIATDTYVADGTFAALEVGGEVAAMRRWLTDEALGDRRFDDQEFAELAHRPTRERIKYMLREHRRFTSADAVVVYVTGHGITGDDNSHLIVLHDTDPEDPAEALRTADLVIWLAKHQGLNQAMIIIDVCQAGRLDDNLPAKLKENLPDGWLLVVTAPAGADAKLGAFTGAVESVMAELRIAAGSTDRVEPYLEWLQFFQPVARQLRERHHQRPRAITYPWQPPSVYLPNPGYDAERLDPVVTDRARRDLAIFPQDMTAHWAHRAPVAGGGPVFTGRARLMRELIAFTAGEAGTLVVAGRAGSGKSGVLSRLVTCSDPDFRARNADVLAVAEPVPPEDSVDIAILATGKTSDQIVRQLAGALRVDGPAPWASPGEEAWIQAITDALMAAGHTFTIVIDALDEATDPGAVLSTVLTRLNTPENRRLRLLVGVRSSGGPHTPGSDARDLASLATITLGARRIGVDDDEFWEPSDLAAYVRQILGQPGSPYQDPYAAAAVADAVEAHAGRSYLVAGLTARALADLDRPLAPGDPRLQELLAEGSAELIGQDLRTSSADADDRRRALCLLRASALAEGRGIPVRTVWPLLATATANDMTFGDRDVAWLLGHRLGGYLVRDVEDGLTVYRPFHDELRQVLRTGRNLDTDGPLLGETQAHRGIARALLPMATWGAGRTMPPHPYARRHLAAHAAAGDRLDEVLQPETLPFLDEARLSALLRLTEPAPMSEQWLLLSAWRTVRHRWSWDDPDANAAALDVARLAVDPAAHLPVRRTTSGLTWRPRLAAWQSGGTIIAGDDRGGLKAQIGLVQGVPVLVTGGPFGVRLWDPATAQPIGEALYATGLVRAIALAEGPGLVLAACDGGRVVTWDALTRLPSITVEVPEPSPTALAVGEYGGRWAVAAGGRTGVVQVRWLDSGDLAREFHGEDEVRSIALATGADGRLHLAIGYGDGEDGYVTVHDAVLESPGPTRIDVRGEVTDVALALLGGDLVVAAGTSRGKAGVWEAFSGLPISPLIGVGGEVGGVAVTAIGETRLLATGSHDRTAQVWDLSGGFTVSEPLPHPAPVQSVAFGQIEGRKMLVTGCLDGNTRIWDPLRPTAARVSVDARFPSVAMDAGIVAAGTDDGYVRLWDATGLHPYPPIAIESPVPTSYLLRPAGVEVWLGGTDPRTLITQHRGQVSVWDVSEPSRPAFRWSRVITAVSRFEVSVAGGQPLVALLDQDGDVVVFNPLVDATTLSAHIDGASEICFLTTPDRVLLGVEAADGVHLIDLASGLPERTHGLRTLPRHGVVGRLDGQDVLADLDDDGLRLIGLRTGELTTPQIATSTTANGVAWGRVADRDVVLTAHFATVRVWNPRTGRKLTELRFGTRIEAIAVRPTDDGGLLVAVCGPGLVLAELRELPS